MGTDSDFEVKCLCCDWKGAYLELVKVNDEEWEGDDISLIGCPKCNCEMIEDIN